MKFFTNKTLAITGGIAALLLGSLFLGRYLGNNLGAETLAQMRLVWPAVLGIEENNRRFLVELALECKVVSEPPKAVAVLQCLSRAVDARDKKSGTSEAHERFRKLLREYPPNAT